MNDSRCVLVPLNTAGCVAVWIGAALALLGDQVLNDGLWKVGMFLTGLAAAWTVLIGNHNEHCRVVEAVERRVRRVLNEDHVADLDAARY